MLNINEDDLKAAIVEKAADEILRHDDDLSAMIRQEVKVRLDKIFTERASPPSSARRRRKPDWTEPDPLAQPGRIEPWSHEGSGLSAQADAPMPT